MPLKDPQKQSMVVGAGIVLIAMTAIWGGYRFVSGMMPSGANASIQGPTAIALGSFAEFDGRESAAYEWEWSVYGPNSQPVTFHRLDSGSRIVVHPEAEGRYVVNLLVRSAAWAKLSTSSLNQEFVVGTPQPQPPGPTPPGPLPPGPTPPVPPKPDDLQGYAKTAHDLAIKHVPADGRAGQARAIASGLRGVQAAIAAGTIHTVVEAGSAAVESVDSNITGNRDGWESWKSAVFSELNKGLTRSTQIDRVAEVIGEVSAGLEKVN